VRWLPDRLRDRVGAGERGSAIVEFVFIALVVFLPLVYVVAGFSAVQRGVFASTEAAREAGRAIGTAPDAASGLAQAERAAQLAVQDQSVNPVESTRLLALSRRSRRPHDGSFFNRPMHDGGKNAHRNTQPPDEIVRAKLVVEEAAEPYAKERTDLVRQKHHATQHAEVAGAEHDRD